MAVLSVSYQREKRLALMVRAAAGDRTATFELERRDRLAHLKREALAEVSTCPRLTAKGGRK